MNKNVLITGGTRGIGEAISREFAKKGYNLIINYVNSKEKAEKLKNELEEKYNIDVLTIQADLADEKAIENMVDISMDKFGKVDVLVNNAGIVIDKEFEDRTIEDWKQTLNINLIAPFILTKLIGKEMVKNKGGAIINISSTNGINTYYPTSVDYDASKSGLISLTYDSAVELAPCVRVNCIAPGWVNTEMNKELSEDFVKEESERILVKRFAEPEEIAKVATFLASDDASFINSTVIKVDGGWH
jgi:3-oxoacyl-[acyl-carrier protein] reductase